LLTNVALLCTNDLDQLIRRLFAGTSALYTRTLSSILTAGLTVRSYEPEDIVRDLHLVWKRGGVELSEEIYDDLAMFRRGRRHLFITALSKFVQGLDVLDIDHKSSHSETSSMTFSGEMASTERLTCSVGDSTMNEKISHLANAGRASSAACTVHSIAFGEGVSPSSTQPHVGSESI
jgi:hypothetical protein